MKRFIEGEDRSQITLFPESLEDYVAEDNPVRVQNHPLQGLPCAGTEKGGFGHTRLFGS